MISPMRFKNLGKVLVWNSRKSHNCCLLLLLPLLGFFVLWTCVVFHESVFPYGSFPTKTRLSSVFILKSDSFGSVCYDLRCVLFNIFRIYFIYMIFFNVPTYIKKKHLSRFSTCTIKYQIFFCSIMGSFHNMYFITMKTFLWFLIDIHTIYLFLLDLFLH